MTKPALLAVVFLAAGFGCTDDSEPGDVCSHPDGICKSPDESNDEVGDGDGDAVCVTEPDDDSEPDNGHHVVHQCNGHMDVTLAFRVTDKDCAEVLGSEELCSETHVFGEGEEPYAMPAVMACCDADDAPGDEVLRFCTADLVAQVCLSVSKRVESMIGEINGAEGIPNAFKPEAKKQVKKLLEYIDDNQQACFDALHKPLGDGVIDSATWSIPNSKKWWALKDFTITIDKAVIESASLPQETTSIAGCDDNKQNDAEVFEERGAISPTLGVDSHGLASPLDVLIAGPRLSDGRQANGTARATPSCSDACSHLSVSQPDRGLAFEDLTIHADAGARVALGDTMVTVDGLALRLYGAVGALPLRGNNGEVYVVEPRRARFMATGSIGGVSGTRWVENADPIVIQAWGDGWAIEPFVVEHVGTTGAIWRATVPAARWD